MNLAHRALVPVLAAGAVTLGSSPAAHAATPSCSSLRGASIVKTGPVRVVDRTYRMSNGRTGHRYVACPRNREFSGGAKQLTLRASRAGGRLQILDARGPVLAVRDVATRAVHVWNVGTRKRRRVQSDGRNPSGRVLVGEAGEAAATFGTRLIGFDYDGTSYRLDAGPIDPASLRHGEGNDISWRRGGATGRANLATPGIPCARMKGKVFANTPELRVVSIRFPSELLEGAIDGTTERFRACTYTGGPVLVLGESVFSNQAQGGAGVEVLAFDGTRVMVLEQTADSGGDTNPRRISTVEVRGGERIPIWGNTDAGGPNANLGDAVGYALAPTGHAAIVFTVSGAGPDEEQVVGFTPAGQPQVLDRAPATEIDETATSIDGSRVEWTRGGQRRSAQISG